MAYVKIQPPGVVPVLEEDRQAVIKVISGDTWTVNVNKFNPRNPVEPATPDNTLIRVVLSETQFDNPIWVGSWYAGVYPDPVRKDLCQIRIPREITKNLRRGNYLFSLRASDLLMTSYVTEVQGSFLVEYTPTSDQHSIPYKDGTSREALETLEIVRDIEAEFDAFKAKFDFSEITSLTAPDTLKKVKETFNSLLTVLKEVNK